MNAIAKKRKNAQFFKMNVKPTSYHDQKCAKVSIEQENIEDIQVEKAEVQKFLDFNGLDIKGLSNIFNTYATKKTYATGFFNLALIATNFTQLKQIIAASSIAPLSVTNVILLSSICISLLLQLILVVVLVFLAKNGEFYDNEKREQLIRRNNAVTLIVLTISVINVFINIFLNV